MSDIAFQGMKRCSFCRRLLMSHSLEELKECLLDKQSGIRAEERALRLNAERQRLEAALAE